MTTPSKSAPDDRNTKNPLEWIVFAVSGLLVLGTIGFLIHNAISQKDQPAILEARIAHTERRDGVTIVTILVANTGNRTAADVNVEVDAKFPDREKTATLTIDFIPRHGNREGYVAFTDPAEPITIQPRIAGYVEP